MNYDTSKIDEWTVEMCQGYLADRAGWTTAVLYRTANLVWREKDCPNSTHTGDPTQWQHEHPIPATLDESSKLPDPSTIFGATHINIFISKCDVWNAQAHYIVDGDPFKYGASGDTEILARFRLRCVLESLTVRAEIN